MGRLRRERPQPCRGRGEQPPAAHLQKIIFCTEEQTGENGLFGTNVKGTCYYRFGDVVCDAEGYYWVCVRPSSYPNKGDSHWINIFNATASGNFNGQKRTIPEKNVKTDWSNVEKYDFKTLNLPTKLTYSREHIYNLCNLIWALRDIDNYKTTCAKNKGQGLGGFDYTYNGQQFLYTVNYFWEAKGIWQKLFSISLEEMQELGNIYFFYQGYSWLMATDPSMWIYNARKYEPTLKGSASDDKREYDWKNGFDIYRYVGDADADKDASHDQFRYENSTKVGYWVVRYKSGEDLCSSGKYNRYEKIGGCTDIYCYNTEKGINPGENTDPEDEDHFKPTTMVLDKPILGCVIGSDGKFYLNKTVAQANGTKAVAAVVCLNENKPVDDIEKQYNALAIALSSKKAKWANENYDYCYPMASKNFDVESYTNGSYFDKYLIEGCNERGHIHPAAALCTNGFDDLISPAVRQEKGFSDWFLPAAGQWVMILKALGYSFDNGYGTFRAKDGAIRAGKFGLTKGRSYWTSTPYYYDDEQLYAMVILFDENSADYSWRVKSSEHYVCPFIAFKY